MSATAMRTDLLVPMLAALDRYATTHASIRADSAAETALFHRMSLWACLAGSADPGFLAEGVREAVQGSPNAELLCVLFATCTARFAQLTEAATLAEMRTTNRRYRAANCTRV